MASTKNKNKLLSILCTHNKSEVMFLQHSLFSSQCVRHNFILLNIPLVIVSRVECVTPLSVGTKLLQPILDVCNFFLLL